MQNGAIDCLFDLSEKSEVFQMKTETLGHSIWHILKNYTFLCGPVFVIFL